MTDEPLPWQETTGKLTGEVIHHAEGYHIYPYRFVPDKTTLRLEGNGLDVMRNNLDELKQLAQEHYDRERQLKAWEDYMLTHDPPACRGCATGRQGLTNGAVEDAGENYHHCRAG